MFEFNNKKIVVIVLVFLILSLKVPEALSQTATPAAVPRISPDAVVVTVGDVKLTARDAERILQNLPPQSRNFFSSPGGRAQYAEWLVSTKLFVKEAEARELQNRDEVKLRLNIARESILVKAVEEEIVKEIKISDDDAKKFLSNNIEKFELAKARRIVIRTQSSNQFYADGKPSDQLPTDEAAKAKAEDIRKKLTNGADFEEMAAKSSDDPMTSGKGGDLGYVRRTNQDPKVLLTPPMLEAIFALKPGEISPVIQTPFGFELFKVEDRRAAKLEEVRSEVDNLIRQQKYDGLYQDMKMRNNVKVDEAYFRASSSGKSAEIGRTR